METIVENLNKYASASDRNLKPLSKAVAWQSKSWIRLLRRAQHSSQMRLLSQALALPLLIFILVYQKTISPDHGIFKEAFPYGYCKFHPTCSEYSALVLKAEGLIGLPKIIKRLFRCRPSAVGGIDLP